jgi:hypothetical protein
MAKKLDPVSRAHCGAKCRCAEPGPSEEKVGPGSAVHRQATLHRVRDTEQKR